MNSTITKKSFIRGLVAGLIAIPLIASAATVTFQQGVGGYTGTVDTYVNQTINSNGFGPSVNILVDSAGPLAHGLIRFDNIFGPGAGQVPAGAEVTSATLTVRTFNDGDTVQFYRMLKPWSTNDTWDTLVNGISADNVEALSTVDASFTGAVPVPRVDAIDLTAAVQSWAVGTVTNYGWAILPTAGNGWQIDSSDATTAANRPLLTITFTVGVTNPIVINTQPQDQTVGVGAPVTFSVSASGTAPRYQWYRGSSPIPNATNTTYQIASAQSSDEGNYHVVVSNSVSSVTSRDALLAVVTPPFVVVGLTNYTWKYEQSGTDLGTAWRATNYNDSTWSSGRGILAYENGGIVTSISNLTNTVLSPASLPFITRYFRTSFVFTNDPNAFSLTTSNYFDDGAVVYLNGVEAFRFNMPAGNITFSTTAPAANPLGEGVFVVSNIPPNLVRQGTNVVAVEVHQQSATSSDVDFGMAILVSAIPPTPLSIISQPQSIVVNESQTATFLVGVQGGPAYFRWFKDGVAIPNATFNPFSISITSTNDAGSYFVVVSNIINSVTSSVAILTIIPDTNAPVLLEADGTSALTNILVSFSERITLNTATNITNYRVTNTISGTALTISSATLVDGTNVLLATSARTAGQNYILVVNRLRDFVPSANVIATNSSIPVRSLASLVALNGAWKFWDPLEGFDQEDLGTAWKEYTYNTSSPNVWGDGSSIFYNHPDSQEIPGPLGTPLSQTASFTSYFRTGFDFQASPGGLELALTHVIDDGAVVYLNGNEVLRYNLPTGTINYQTPSSVAIGDVARVGPTVVQFGRPRLGANVLAVEVHQATSNNFDKVFGLQLDARAQSFVIGPVVITRGPTNITTIEGASASFEAIQAAGLTFQWQSNGVPILGATNPVYTIPAVTLAMNGSTYRVAISNSTSFAISTNAILTVSPDPIPPVLLGAVITTNGTIVVSFSEGMSTASATLASNYRITNSAGANIAVSSAVLSNGTNVILTVAGLPANTYTLIVSNVQDRAVVPNTISPNPSVATIGYEGPLQILGLAGSWKYDQSGTDLGTLWRGVGYNDAAWPSGQALLAVETATLPDTIRTPLTLGPVTYYFRSLTNAPTGGNQATLRIRTVLDDGAVFYLNGVEILRVRLAADATIAYGTLAANQPTEGVIETFDVVVTNLVAGQNLFAVEVHQTAANSSDIVFGAEITLLRVNSAVASTPLQITSQPQSRANAVGTTASFTVVASGTGPIFYQWRKGGVNIPNETNTTLTVPNVQLSDNGNAYTVVVTNSTSSVTSLVATLTVTNTSVCTYSSAWTNSFRLATNELRQTVSRPTANSTRIVLSWSNPVTNSCGSNAVVVLQRTTALLNPSGSTVWSDIFTNTFGNARVTNTVLNSNVVFYRLRVP